MPTDYTAPLTLWVVLRRRRRHDGAALHEPAWVGDGEQASIALFVSRLHAQIYATLRNTYGHDGGPDSWHCVPLQSFDLYAVLRELDGTVDCAVTFGLACDDRGALIIAAGAPCVRYFEVTFDLPDRCPRGVNVEASFGFGEWVFEDMRAQWAQIGAHTYEQSIRRMESMDDITFLRTIDAALRTATPGRAIFRRNRAGDGNWMVYDTEAMRWIVAQTTIDAWLPTATTLH
ncbi:hypothetical protein [Paraburkholderia sp. J12]|uniref:hypothetical protein n=1 Tax=Paraburkholderia sp. J12 TaxID=2805432 RepID=UPI002ABD910A|nr:hypothetical protein [Paraburkholderia sp. J12]